MKHEITMATVDRTSYANLVLLQRLYARLENRAWARARKKFLQEELAKHGSLKCYYCGHDNLGIKSKKKNEVATVDHFIAKSNGGDPYSCENFRVCCSSCNKKKGSNPAEEFLCSKYLKEKIQSIPKQVNDTEI